MDIKNAPSREELRALLKKQSKLFHDISNLDEQSFTVKELLKEAAQLIAADWIDPEEISAAFSLHEKEWIGDDFEKSDWFISVCSEIKKEGRLHLLISSKKDRTFLEEEIKLAEVLVQNIASKTNRIIARLELEEEQVLLDKAYKLAHIGTWEYDMINDELHWSEVTKEVHGFGPDYNPDVESTIQLFKAGYNRDAFEKAATDAIEREIPFDVELKIVSGKGDERWIRATGEPEYNEEGECIRFYGISQNVTNRRKAEEDLEHNERRFKAMVRYGMDMIAILDDEANYKYVSPAAKNVLGIRPDYFLNKNAFEFIHEDDAPRLRRQFDSLKYQDTTQLKPFRFLDSEKNWRWVESTITNLSDDPAIKGYVANSRDVTERQIKQEEILQSLKEKETLLAEVHHRIKNNLSVLTGLLQMQAASEDNEEVMTRLFDSVARINTVASIHDQLYKSNEYGEVEFAERIQLLAQSIHKTIQTETNVSLNFQCEPLKMSVPRALPCSLIVNEVLTNIYKHAFEEREKGRITISLTQTDIEDYMKLCIEDDGVGIPENFNPKESSSLGLKLIDMLSEQINAQYFYESDGSGTSFNLLFSKEK
jgi:PAS domain S-box-containing protein